MRIFAGINPHEPEMKDMILNNEVTERAVLVGLVTPAQSETKAKEYLDELEFLADTAGAETVKTFTQKLDYPNPRTFVGKGKLEEIREYIEANDIGMAIFDDDLTSKQVSNIESELKVKILDRTSLILDIFAKRAQTANAKTQVELAQYQYLLPRLTRMWTHLERQRGGIGMRGPGETQIETDRRIILDRISRLKEELKSIDKQKSIQRKNRGKLTRVALVGYTNVGKSTLMNLLSKSDVFAENKLFATLDTTVRKVTIENLPFLLTDTVGSYANCPRILSIRLNRPSTRCAKPTYWCMWWTSPTRHSRTRLTLSTRRSTTSAKGLRSLSSWCLIKSTHSPTSPKTRTTSLHAPAKTSPLTNSGPPG